MSSQTNASFSRIAERDVTRALAREYAAEFEQCIESDVLIAGAGPSGLMCGKVLAEQGYRVVIVEKNNYLGGGFWMGGYLMNKVVVRAPSHTILQDLGVPVVERQEGLFVADAPHACSRLIAAACDAGVKIRNMSAVEDVVVTEDERLCGLVVNWSSIQWVPRPIGCLDPIALESKVVIDATGHDASVAQCLANQSILDIRGCGPMCVQRSEDEVVEHTSIVYPGLIAVGMAVSAVFGLPRMGPSFGAMLVSGIRGAELAHDYIEQYSAEAPTSRVETK